MNQKWFIAVRMLLCYQYLLYLICLLYTSDPYKAAYGSMPSHASANPEIKQLYINGHFCYVFKFGIVTNGLGIIRHISFYNKNFMTSHPDIVVKKKSDSPDEDKCVHDSKLLIPTLKDFFSRHPLINPKRCV